MARLVFPIQSRYTSPDLTVAVEGMKVMTALGAGSTPSTSSSPSSATTATGIEASFSWWVRLTSCGTSRW